MSGALKVCNGRPPQLDGWQAKAMISAPQLVPAGNSIITLYGSNVMVNQKKKIHMSGVVAGLKCRRQSMRRRR
jgi:hypothetical protein